MAHDNAIARLIALFLSEANHKGTKHTKQARSDLQKMLFLVSFVALWFFSPLLHGISISLSLTLPMRVDPQTGA
jgi:hypothetical protein